jgi:anti-sigma regulatory factor (Ser/Thr protein kinase)
VPLNRPAQTLAPGPRGALQARRWVAEVCEEIGRSELRDNAELAMSEVVTNAILHGRAPISVRLRGTRDHPRVEVRDASPDPPSIATRGGAVDLLDDLPTFGRGLSIVASASEAWGAERDGDGKLVWFVPAVLPLAMPTPGVLLGWEDEAEEPSYDGLHAITVHLLHVPPDALQGTLAHGAELRRELRLLALAHQDTYPVASDLSTFFSEISRDFRGQLGGDALLTALRSGRPYLDLEIKAGADTATRFARLIELLDLADAFCRNERLLTLARTRAQVVFQTWLFGQFVRQAGGEDPLPWSDSAVDDEAWPSRSQP